MLAPGVPFFVIKTRKSPDFLAGLGFSVSDGICFLGPSVQRALLVFLLSECCVLLGCFGIRLAAGLFCRASGENEPE